MTEEAKRCVEALRDNINNGFLLVGGFNGSVHASEIIHLIESMSKQLDDQTVVIDRIYEQCKTLQNDLEELGFDSIADMYAQLEQVEQERDGLNIMLAQAQAMLETRTKERDVAIRDIEKSPITLCNVCAHYHKNFPCSGGNGTDKINITIACTMFKWRGVQEVE